MPKKDVTGERFGRLVALRQHKDKSKGVKWECICDCGNTTIVKTPYLCNGDTKSCGCLMQKGTPKDHTGKQYGKLTAISSTGKTNNNGSYIWNLVCDCGEIVVRDVGNLVFRAKNGVECSCEKCELITLGNRSRTHGLSKGKEWNTWRKIKERCFSENDIAYSKYGAAGITMCDEWVDNFQAFYEHIGACPVDGQKWSVDRIDNTKGYEPDNVRWATSEGQARNKTFQTNNTSGAKGVSWDTKVHPCGTKSTLYAKVQWTDENSKHRTKAFNANTYGKDEAFRMACEYRIIKLLEANEKGAGYTHDHIYGTKENKCKQLNE